MGCGKRSKSSFHQVVGGVIRTNNCNKCPYKYKTQHTYKHGMVDIITMCKLYDRQLYYYGNDIPKPDHKHNCFEEIELERVDRLDLVKIDIDKLRDYIDKFEHKYNKKIGRGCNDIEDVIRDIVEDSLEAIRSNLRELADEVDTGEYSNKEISDKLAEIIKRI